jgi:cytidyltransferase-like protein
MKIVAVSGYFICLHAGHIEYLQKASELGRVTVILNNDKQQKLKYGKIIVPFKERKIVMESIKYVSKVVESIDTDRSVRKTLRMLYPDIFAKGGDRTAENIPEKAMCDEFKIKIVDGLGKKIQSSSKILKKL